MLEYEFKLKLQNVCVIHTHEKTSASRIDTISYNNEFTVTPTMLHSYSVLSKSTPSQGESFLSPRNLLVRIRHGGTARSTFSIGVRQTTQTAWLAGPWLAGPWLAGPSSGLSTRRRP